jgi:3-deoxy-7-phosphoheptulonate synthase
MIVTNQGIVDDEIAVDTAKRRNGYGDTDTEDAANEASTDAETEQGIDTVRSSLPPSDGEAGQRLEDPYRLASSRIRPGERTVLDVCGQKIGGEHFALIAGPCTVESRQQTLETAHAVAAAGASMFRGGAYKPRTSPYSFQGLGTEGLRILAEAKAQTGLPIVTELMDMRDLEAVLEVADVVQIGARNMQNYPLLTEVGRSGRTVLLKRGLSSTLEELLLASEYILREGNPNVILCERGIRTFETAYRFTLDLMAVPVLKELSHLPVVVDPSHAAGRRDLVGPLSLAAAAIGADGIIVEVHPDPEQAICDGPQALPTDRFAAYASAVKEAAEIARAY